jgi:hypothetical protein
MEQLNYKEELDTLRGAGFTPSEISRLHQLRRAYVRHELDWGSADLARLRFMRWLVQNGRLMDDTVQRHASQR